MEKREVVIVGAGPAGLAASIEAAKAGAQVLVVDLNMKPGGQLFKQIHKFFGSSAHHAGMRGIDIGTELLDEAQKAGVELWLNSTVIGLFPGNKVGIEDGSKGPEKKLVTVHADEIIVAAGASENVVRFKGWTTPGVMGAGAAQTMINVHHVKPGTRAVMIGSGNVGLIVSYQMMQAGIDVAALVEAAPKIGGYAVHAAKIRRAGIPIYTGHTIIEAVPGSDGTVSKVITAQVGSDFKPVEGTQQTIDADLVTIATGLKPSTELLRLMNCELVFDGAFGGYVPLHNRRMETSVKNIFAAGDTAGVEEASTALEEGRLAGISAAESLGYILRGDAEKERDVIWARLDALRMGPFGERRMIEKKKILDEFNGKVGTPVPEFQEV